MIAPDLRPDDNRLSFEDVYRRHERDIVRYLTLLLGSPHDAEDVAADTFGRAFEAWREGRGPAGRHNDGSGAPSSATTCATAA